MDIHTGFEDGGGELLNTETVGGLIVAVGEPYDFSNGFFNFFVFFLRKDTLTAVKRAEKIYLNQQLFLPFFCL